MIIIYLYLLCAFTFMMRIKKSHMSFIWMLLEKTLNKVRFYQNVIFLNENIYSELDIFKLFSKYVVFNAKSIGKIKTYLLYLILMF